MNVVDFCGKLEGNNIEYYMNIPMDPMGYRQMPKYLVSYWKENLPPLKTKTYPNYGRGLAHLPSYLISSLEGLSVISHGFVESFLLHVRAKLILHISGNTLW